MAFPTVASSASFVTGSNSTTHNVTMPATVNAGDLLIVIASKGLFSNTTITTPAGWSVITTSTHSPDAIRVASYYKIAAGTEGGTTVNFATGDSCGLAARIYRITGWHGTTPPEGAAATTSTGNPPSLTPSWGAEDTLWIAALGSGLTTQVPASPPTSYANLGTANDNIGNNNRAKVSTADRSRNAATEDPGAFVSATANTIIGLTIAIRPSNARIVLPDVTFRIRGVTAPNLAAGATLGAAILSGNGALSADGLITLALAGAVDLSGLGSMVVDGGQLIVFGFADLTGAGDLSAAGTSDLYDSGVITITGAGDLAAIAEAFASGVANLTGLGSIVVAGSIKAVLGSAVLTGTGTLVVGPAGLIFVVNPTHSRRAAQHRVVETGHAAVNQEAIDGHARMNVPHEERFP